ncbi:MAG: SCO family protein [Hyphomicrobium sp.]
MRPGRRVTPRTVCARLAGCCIFLFAAFALAAPQDGLAASLYPAPGTYPLYKIQKAGSGWVIEESAWWPRRFSHYTSNAITLLSFFYSTCSAPAGCPAAWSAFEDVHAAVQKDRRLRGRVRLVFVSLDPRVDTPERLSVFADNRRDSRAVAPWHFLTTWSEAYLQPLLDAMGQDAARALDAQGRPTPVINHTLKVFLIDRDQWVREIYTTAFLVTEVLINDITTLVMEEDAHSRTSATR